MSPEIIVLPCTLINSIYIKYSFITCTDEEQDISLIYYISTWVLHNGPMKSTQLTWNWRMTVPEDNFLQVNYNHQMKILCLSAVENRQLVELLSFTIPFLLPTILRNSNLDTWLSVFLVRVYNYQSYERNYLSNKISINKSW